MRAHLAALAGLASALLVAIVVYGMPVPLALAAAGNGLAYGLFPIGWIVLSAIFLYDLTVMTGKFEIVKQTIAGLASDRRIQALLIGFSFGAFIEGAAGFGTPVAICCSHAYRPGFQAVTGSGPVAHWQHGARGIWGVGNADHCAGGRDGFSLMDLSAMVGRQLPLFSVVVPFWIVWAMAGRKGMLEVWPACLVSGLAFAIPQFVVSNFYGPSLVDIASALSSIFFLVLFLRFWQPRQTWRFSHDLSNGPIGSEGTATGSTRIPPRGPHTSVARNASSFAQGSLDCLDAVDYSFHSAFFLGRAAVQELFEQYFAREDFRALSRQSSSPYATRCVGSES